MPRPRRRPHPARLLLVVAGILAIPPVAELVVRRVAPQPAPQVDRGLYLADPPRRYRLHPGFRGTIGNRREFTTPVAINGAGLRGPEIGPRAGGSRRLLVLGDSYAFGLGARDEEAYPARLAEQLSTPGRPVEVLNAGTPGFGVPDQVAWYEAWGTPLSPDLVILTVFVGDDLQDATYGERKVKVVDGALVAEGENHGRLSRWLETHSQLYALLGSSPAGGFWRGLVGRRTTPAEAAVAAELELCRRGDPSKAEFMGGAATDEALRKLLLRTGPGRVAAVLVPSVLMVDPAEWERAVRAHRLDPTTLDPDRPTEFIRSLFDRRGIPALDLSEAFTTAIAHGEQIYWPIDRHLTPAGNALAAAEVARFLAGRFPALVGNPPRPATRPAPPSS